MHIYNLIHKQITYTEYVFFTEYVHVHVYVCRVIYRYTYVRVLLLYTSSAVAVAAAVARAETVGRVALKRSGEKRRRDSGKLRACSGQLEQVVQYRGKDFISGK